MDLDLFFMLPYSGGAAMLGIVLLIFQPTRWVGIFLLTIGLSSAVLSLFGAFFGLMAGANISSSLHELDMRRTFVNDGYWIGMVGGAFFGALFAGVATWNRYVLWRHVTDAMEADVEPDYRSGAMAPAKSMTHIAP